MFILKPSFYDEFQCSADKCSFTCCQGWKILVEKEICEKYPEYQELITGKEETSLETAGKFSGYKLPLLENRMCPFCNPDQLCNLVIKYGEEALGYVCQTFPRTSVVTGETEELFLSLACPRVVELLSDIKGLLTFVMEEDDREVVDKSKMSRSERDEEDKLRERLAFDVGLRDRMIDLLQDRSYPLWFRQFACIYSMDKVKELHYRDERKNTVSELEKILSSSYLQQLFHGLDAIDTDKRRKFIQLQQLFFIFSNNLLGNAGQDRDRNCLKIEELIQLNQHCTFEQYSEACGSWINENGAAFDLLAEHLSVYEWYGYGMLAMDRYYFLDNCIGIMLEQLLIRYSMVLYYSKRQRIGKNTQEFIISLFSRLMDHDRQCLQRAVSQMKEKNMLSIDNLFLLLK